MIHRGGVAALLALVAAAGCDAEGGPPPTPRLTADDLGAVRARLSACLGSTMSQAVAFGGPAALSVGSDATIDCVASSSDCAGVTACLGLDGPPCDGEGRCEGNVAVACVKLPNGSRVEVPDDCGARTDGNNRCDVVDDDGAGIFALCNAGPCAGDRCAGDERVYCLGGVEIREPCAAGGLVCATDWEGPFCALPEPCAADHCDGDAAVICRGGHVGWREECAALMPGGRCRADGALIGCVADPPDPACAGGEPYRSTCDGVAGVACYAGARLSVDCPAFLGSTCEMDPTLSEARCRLPE
jgi:hypothetical protein